MSKMPWMMSQEWHDVLFLHWPVSPDVVSEHIPSELKLDLYNNKAWVSLVFFRVKRNRPRFIPFLPGMNSFLQLNVRTYVTHKGRVGVHFFNLDADHPFVVKMMLVTNFLPYRYAKMSLKRDKRGFFIHSNEKNSHETLMTTFQPNAMLIEKGPLELWLTERYHLWTKVKDNLFRIDISHSPWLLQSVNGTILKNTMAFSTSLTEDSPKAHYSKLKKARLFPPVKE